MNPEIFREYDIRGIVGQDLNDEVVEILGRAIGTYFRGRGKKETVLGRDCRLSSPAFAAAHAANRRPPPVGVVIPRRPAFEVGVLELGDAVLLGDGRAELIISFPFRVCALDPATGKVSGLF